MSREKLSTKLVNKLEKIYANIAKAKDFKLIGYDILATGPAHKIYEFPSYDSGIFFISEIAKYAEDLSNYPELSIKGNKVKVSILNYEMGAVTEEDLHLAIAIEDLFKTITEAHKNT